MRTLLALLLLASVAQAQSLKDLVEIDGARANKIRGYGLVTGLNGAGDSPRGESARLLRSMLQNLVAPEVAVQEITARNAALVMVTAELAPFQKEGTRLDVGISAVGDAKSLYGGELQLTDLRGPGGRQDPNVYALASGRLVLEGDARRGNPTVAAVPGGAIVEKPLAHVFVKEKGGSRVVRLSLKKPDLSTASRIASRINAALLPGVATASDGGAVEVRIPALSEQKEPAVDYEREPVRWIEALLALPISLARAESATVVLNDATKAVSWSGDVRLHEGSVMLPSPAPGGRPGVFHAREGQALSDFMEKTGPALNDQQILDLVKALHSAGLLQAELRTP